MDTIFALATARGKSGVAVIRVSGSKAFDVARQLAGPLPEPRRTGLRKFRAYDDEVIDEGLVICFERAHSFTGEESVEFQGHGSPAIISKILKEIGNIPGVRQADAGEFTRRALENDRMDLAQIEGLGDLIAAETEAQRRQAMRIFSGELGRRTQSWRDRMIRAMALIEATIDFVDEDVPFDVMPEVSDLISGVAQELRVEMSGYRWSERVRSGFRVAIIGAPNTGKSTLLNYLAGREVAITSEVAGTTRDVIEVQMDLDGLPVIFQDTAGIRESPDKIEGIGIQRALKIAEEADIRIFLGSDDQLGLGLRGNDIVLVPKDDEGLQNGVSGVTGFGVAKLFRSVVDCLSEMSGDGGLAVRERHRVAMGNAIHALEAATSYIEFGSEHADILAENLRRAVYSVESLVGRVDVEHILDRIFSQFCIGK